MKRKLVLGGWYALIFAAALLAESRMVSRPGARVTKEASDFSEDVTTLEANDRVETTGDKVEGYLPVKTADGKTGWIAESDLYTLKEEQALSKTTGAGGAAAEGQEGAYVKGFDPEVEGKFRADNPSLDKVYQEEVLPLIWLVRAGNDGNKVDQSKALEQKEEDQEKLWMQNRKAEADAMQAEIDKMRSAMQPARDAWQSALRTFRQNGKIGEFAGRK